MNRKLATLVQSFGALILTIISIIQGLILVPLYLQYISVGLYGYWLSVMSIVTLVSVLNFAFGNIVIQKVASSYAKKNLQEVVEYYYASIILLLIISIIYILVGYILSFYLTDILSIKQEFSKNLLIESYFIYLFAILLSFYNDSLRGFSQSLLKPLYPVVTSILARVSSIVIVIVLLRNDIGLLALPVSLFIAEFIIFVLNFVNVYKNLRELNQQYIVNVKIIKEYLSLIPSLFLARLGGILSDKTLPIIITNFISAEATVAYVLAKKLADVILQITRVFISSLSSTLTHFITTVEDTDNIKLSNQIKQLFELNIYSLTFLLSLYLLFNKVFISLWISQDILLEQSVTIFIGLSIISVATIELFKQILYCFADFIYVSRIMFLFGLSVILLSILSAPFSGLLGIVVSVFLSSLVVLYLIYKRVKEKNIFTSFTHKDVKSLSLTLAYLTILSIIVYMTNINVNSWLSLILAVSVSSVIVITIIFIINLESIKYNLKSLRR